MEKQRDELRKLYDKRNDLKSMPKSIGNSKTIAGYQKWINDILYLPDIITVYANTTKKDYKDVAKKTFNVNGITYRRLCAGAGHLRRNTVLFVNDELYEQLELMMLCGLTKGRVGEINLSKFSAYYSLYSSSTNFITSPNVCVVADYERVLKDQCVVWIDENMNVSDKIIDIEQNVFDGSGLVSVEMAEQWNKDLEIYDYKPSAYIIRSAWIKGLCVVFDWKRFAKDVARKTKITDVWGKDWNVKDIDVILSTSQFKMWKKYNSWDEYMKYHTLYDHVWGCSRVNKKEDKYMTALNYQYVQSNKFTEESIKKLADTSIDWAKMVCSGERIYALLYLLGCHEYDRSLKEVEETTGMDLAKALMYNNDILNDWYVRDRIYRSIEKKIDQMKIGKLLVEGSYEFAIVDPYMYCEYVFGMEPVGLLKAKQLWQKRWVDKGSKEVAIMRSPLVAPHENNVLEVYSDNKCENWYDSITSGVILNGWDTALMRASDGDVDGDLLMSTDNYYVVSAVDRSLKPIAYEPVDVKSQRISYSRLVDMDTKSFDTKIGFITNLATTFICLRQKYAEGSPEYEELSRRITLLRFHQGSAIDAGKGNIYIPPPRYWHRKEKIDWNSDSEEEIQQKLFNNRLTGDRKSYFMCYIYPKLMKDYNAHRRASQRVCRAMHGCGVGELLKKKDKNDDEKRFTRNYFRFMPTLNNRSILNVLCWHVENIDFDLKYRPKENDFDYSMLMNEKIQVDTDSDLYKGVQSILEKYHIIYEMFTHERKTADDYFYMAINESDEEEDLSDEFAMLFNEIESDLYFICSNRSELCNYVIHVMYNKFKRRSKAIMWNIFGKEILENIKSKSKNAVFPIESNCDEGVEYLGRWYRLKDVMVN